MTVNSRNLGVGLLLHQFVICVMRNFGECIWFGVVAGGIGYTAVLSLITPFESKLQHWILRVILSLKEQELCSLHLSIFR